MNIALVILLLIICLVLGFFVLIQNPKGGGLAGNFGGLGQQMMGVQQSTDTVEKGTWILGAIMGALCIIMVMFGAGDRKSGGKSKAEEAIKTFTGGAAPATAPATGAPATGAPATSAPATGAPATQGAPAQGAPATQSAPATQGAPVTQGAPATGTTTAPATK
jgi:preprotein translocase subunit SecG